MFSTRNWLTGAALAAVTIGAVAAAPLSARAGTLQETVKVPSTATNWSSTLNFAGFDALATGASLNPSQLILSSVAIYLTETLAGAAFATNNSTTSAATGDFALTNTAKLNAGGLGIVTNSQSSATITINAGTTSAPQDIFGSNSASNTFISSLSQFLPGWTGTGSDTATEALSFTGGNLQATFTDSGALSVLVTYTYTYAPAPVPEPTSVALVGLGLLALGLVRAKRA